VVHDVSKANELIETVLKPKYRVSVLEGEQMSLSVGEKESKKGKGMFFVELGKKTNAKNRRTKPCQIRIPEKMQKQKSQRKESWCHWICQNFASWPKNGKQMEA